MNKGHVHRTTAGRVVYNRKTHLMGTSDAVRIIRSVLRTFRDSFSTEKKFVELRDESDRMVQAIISGLSEYFGVVDEGLAVEFAKLTVFSVGSTGLSPIKEDKPEEKQAAEKEN